jgi:uncharacterized protein (DUF2267 family)
MSASIDAKNTWVERILGVRVSAQPPEGTEAVLAELRERFEDVRNQAATLPNAAKAALQARVTAALATIGQTDPARLARDVDALENDLATAMRAARAGEAATSSGDRVTVRHLTVAWQDAQERARQQFDQFVASVLNDDEIKADPLFNQVKAAAAGIARQIPDFGSEIEGALAKIDDASSIEARGKARDAAQVVLTNYNRTLDGAKGLRALQDLSDDEYGGLSFFSELQKAITSLETQLSKVN